MSRRSRGCVGVADIPCPCTYTLTCSRPPTITRHISLPPLQSLVPGLPIALDESGTDMDNVLGGGAPPSDNPLYWVAGGGYFAYLWSQVGGGGLELGASATHRTVLSCPSCRPS